MTRACTQWMVMSMVIGACSLPSFERSEFPCPCVGGFVCVAERCEPADVGDADAVDGSRDGGPTGEVRAFPGARGFGRDASGGRGGQVFHVTHRDDTGIGSLRDALLASGPRTVVFDVSGDIVLGEPIVVRNGDLTIAGQTAPGDGVTLRGHGIAIEASNVVMRYLRVRVGFEEHDPNEEAVTALRIHTPGDGTPRDRIIVDHCSFAWSTRMNLRIRTFPDSTIEDVTVQNCVFAEPLFQRLGAVITNRTARISLVANYWAHTYDRVPFGVSDAGFE